MTVPILGKAIDERFLMHRLKSTSIGGPARDWVDGIFGLLIGLSIGLLLMSLRRKES